MPNPDEARDQAWLRAHLADWERPCWLNGWDAAKRDDQQRIAALVDAVRVRLMHGHDAGCGVGWPHPECSCGHKPLYEALRALVGQTEEVESA